MPSARGHQASAWLGEVHELFDSVEQLVVWPQHARVAVRRGVARRMVQRVVQLQLQQVHFSENSRAAVAVGVRLQNHGGQIGPWRPRGATNRIGSLAEDGQVAVRRMVARRIWPWRPWGMTNQIGIWAEDSQVAVRRMVAQRMVQVVAQFQLQVLHFLEDQNFGGQIWPQGPRVMNPIGICAEDSQVVARRMVARRME